VIGRALVHDDRIMAGSAIRVFAWIRRDLLAP